MKTGLAIFEGYQIRRHYDEVTETRWFSVVDIIRVLTRQLDHRKAQSYWTTLKNRLKSEGSEVVTNCDQLKMPAADGKSYLTDAATTETLLRLIQSVPSPKAEPINLWLAKAGYERMQEMADPVHVRHFDTGPITQADLLDHIRRVGVVFYENKPLLHE